VRDDERRAVQHQVRERVLHEHPRFGVDDEVASSRMRIGESAAAHGRSQALTLPPRQPLATLADERVVSLRSVVMNSCAWAARARFDLLARGGRPPVGDVAANGVVEEHGSWGHDANLRAQRRERTSRTSRPSITIWPPVASIEPRQQVDERRLAGAAPP